MVEEKPTFCLFIYLFIYWRTNLQVVKNNACHTYDLLSRSKPYARLWPHDPQVTVQGNYSLKYLSDTTCCMCLVNLQDKVYCFFCIDHSYT